MKGNENKPSKITLEDLLFSNQMTIAVKDAAKKARRGGIGKEAVIELFEKHFDIEVANDNSGNKESL